MTGNGEKDLYDHNNRRLPVFGKIEGPKPVDYDDPGHYYFGNVLNPLVTHLRQFPVVLGWAFYLTDKEVLDCLLSKEKVGLIVQNTKLWRPEYHTEGTAGWHCATRSHKAYQDLDLRGVLPESLPGTILSRAMMRDESVRVPYVGNLPGVVHTGRLGKSDQHAKSFILCTMLELGSGPVVNPQELITITANQADSSRRAWNQMVVSRRPQTLRAALRTWADRYARCLPLDEDKEAPWKFERDGS